MNSPATVMIIVKIGNEAKTAVFSLAQEYTDKYRIDTAHSINLEFFLGEAKERLAVTWKDLDGGLQKSESRDPAIIDAIVSDPRFVMAFIAAAVEPQAELLAG
nr:hypothetical protein [Brucella intermedia]